MTQDHRWAVLLAGGQGTRLRTLTRRIAGDERPKQFCRLLGNSSLLRQTKTRLVSVAPVDQALFVLLKEHEAYYQSELTDVDPRRMLVQPSDRGTTTAIALALMRLLHIDRKAVVGFFPTDHHYADDYRFAAAVDLAYEEASRNYGRIALIGAQPDCAETEYGWIEPGADLNGAVARLSSVIRFVEKPSPAVAEQLLHQGCLWNTFVMVGQLEMFVRLLNWAVPDVLEGMSSLLSREVHRPDGLERLYQTIPTGDFSHQVLAVAKDRLAVLRLGGPWTDLGTPRRLYAALRGLNCASVSAAHG